VSGRGCIICHGSMACQRNVSGRSQERWGRLSLALARTSPTGLATGVRARVGGMDAG
jgi:hypothetical protein